ncbi:hypothetical protein C8035_v007220 [Colletotrichum spinosum]|uniref:Uncharacterized protein n=1 Tax=Colletotrichum spinosum TaxID=1347390 RepID=A0A4R8QHF8_9PEZI|nr:hypothetical protein C8035_v007220 [Colletotrichum spinosum]
MEVLADPSIYRIINHTKLANDAFGTPSEHGATSPPLPFLATFVWEFLPPAAFFFILLFFRWTLRALGAAADIMCVARQLALVRVLTITDGGCALADALVAMDESYRRYPHSMSHETTRRKSLWRFVP